MNETKITIPMPRPDEILSPKLDVCFKMLFGCEKNKTILIAFLKSILSEPDDDIEELTLLNPMTEKEYPNEKSGILDVKVSLKSGAIIDIEIQVLNTQEIPERILFYLSQIYTRQLSAGESYKQLKKAISIIITNFDLIEECRDYYNKFWFINADNGVRLSDKMEVHILELSKLPEKSDDTMRYKWMKFLSSDKEEMEMLSQNNDAIKLAYEELQRISLDDERRELYEGRLKNLLDENFRMGAAIREGLRRGQTEGMAQGMAQGRDEEKREIARNSLKIGLPPEDIAKITGLDILEIETLV